MHTSRIGRPEGDTRRLDLRTHAARAVPRPGMFATVRNRRGVIAAVEAFDGDAGRLHLVHLDYKDDQLPTSERLVWKLEQPHAQLLEPNALPDPAWSAPMPAEDFGALLRAARWTSAMPFLDPDDTGPLDRLPFPSPFHAAVEMDDYQLVPLLKVLRTPRVNLLIADECHDLMLAPFGEDSDLTKMLRRIAPRFEHRLFLSATPHNGHTPSFTGLLELLDPVRFSATHELEGAMRSRAERCRCGCVGTGEERLLRITCAGALCRGLPLSGPSLYARYPLRRSCW